MVKNISTLALGSFLLAACGEEVQSPKDGTNGFNSLIRMSRFTSDSLLCLSTSGVLIQTGEDENDNGSLDNDEVSYASVVCDGVQGTAGINGTNGINGVNGTNGQDAVPSAYDIKSIIHPCSSNTSSYREVLLQLQNGTIIASFSDNVNGYNTRLAILTPGSYMDTDNSGCTFTLAADGTVTW